jgi:hypothetical protein
MASTSGFSHADRADPVGQGGDVDLDTLGREATAPAVQRQVQAELGEHHLGQQVGAGPTA